MGWSNVVVEWGIQMASPGPLVLGPGRDGPEQPEGEVVYSKMLSPPSNSTARADEVITT